MPAERPCGQPDCPIVDPSTIDRRSLQVASLGHANLDSADLDSADLDTANLDTADLDTANLDTANLDAADLDTANLDTEAVHYRVALTKFADSVFTPPGVGNGRFSPLVERSHSYVAAQRSAALLESALHEAAGPNPRIYRAQLARYELLTLRFRQVVPLIDLRDEALHRLGLDRRNLTGSTAHHYPCTRQVAERLAGAKGTAGLLWTSRQGSLHAERNPDGLASEVLRHESLDVAIVYQPDHDGPSHDGGVDIVDRSPLVVNGEPSRFALELANLLRIAVL